MALERTLKLKFKTTGSSSPSILTKKILARQLGAWATCPPPLVYASGRLSKVADFDPPHLHLAPP